MSEPALADKVVAVHDALDAAGITHAFGGALALAYYAEPRATADVDVNVFVAAERWSTVADAVGPLGVDCTTDVVVLERDGWVRWWWGRTPLDVFFAYDALHDAMREAARRYPFGEVPLPVLSPEHLVTCKAVFDRPKDWLDIEGVLAATEGFSPAEVCHWLDRMLPDDDRRRQRFDELVGTILGR